ncbi:class I SAM-dependent methyltransferase [Mycolicibacterium sp. 050232]|uniref:class I SAM-dependent methyltransferase n=1 Tax=Mycolicibacterium sp. 050232 TaxID=3113982 RepID=UPI002E2C636B|nr:class I SAM-dependent methyltransferase [Mycolicibacterium sp. 050232]MED5812267.1 class I SAM-dependent methyltransferase [Mycolicibacterium sp. 050232]
MTTIDAAPHLDSAIPSFPLSVDGMPHPLALTTASFKAAMWAADRLIIGGRTSSADVQARVTAACNALSDQIHVHLRAGTPDVDELGAFVHRETYPYLGLSTLVDRSYTKPRGYAGDYLTLQMVYDDKPDGVRRLGPYIDEWFLGIPASRAVKNRRQLLRDIIIDTAQHCQGRPTAITSLACGPAREIFDTFAEAECPDIIATCLDIDDQALGYAQGIAHSLGVTGRVAFVQANIVKVALGRQTLELGDQDLVYSIGLIDYLADHHVVKLLDWIYHHLRPGGTAIVGNFDTANPDRAFMDHLLDWKLIHRSPQDLADLFAQSIFGAAPVEVRREATGINLFASASRPACD